MNRNAHQATRYVVGWLCWVVPALTLAGCKGGSPTLPQSSCPSLIAHWKMDDPVGPNSIFITDSVGNHHGALLDCHGQPRFITPQFGPIVVSTTAPAPGSNQALFFVRTFAEVPHDSSLNIDPQCGFRIEMWVQTAAGTQPLLDKFDINTNNGYALYLDDWSGQTGKLFFRLNNSTVTLPGFQGGMGSTWQRVVVKVDPSKTVTLCRDNVCTSPTPVSSIDTTNSAADLWIAATRLLTFNDPAGICPSVPNFHPSAELYLDEVKICGTPNPC